MQNKNQINYYKWNPWIGCHRKSQGCQNCYGEQSFGPSFFDTVQLDLGNFDLPLQRNSKGQYYIKKNSFIALEYNSDFFLSDMDFVRSYIWNIIKIRSDCYFYISTKRPERIKQCLPKDWGEGWDNVDISCTAETQSLIEERLPIYLNIPLKKYKVLVAPLTEEVDLEKFLQLNKINSVSTQGEYCINDTPQICAIRSCNYKWVKKISDQCKKYNVDFAFALTGNYWINEEGKEEFLSPYGWDMIKKAESYNLSSTNMLNLPSARTSFTFVNKEE